MLNQSWYRQLHADFLVNIIDTFASTSHLFAFLGSHIDPSAPAH
jgi:hypothetical protein